jgi:hypothetical protein
MIFIKTYFFKLIIKKRPESSSGRFIRHHVISNANHDNNYNIASSVV